MFVRLKVPPEGPAKMLATGYVKGEIAKEGLERKMANPRKLGLAK
jgi:hypothetical protein